MKRILGLALLLMLALAATAWAECGNRGTLDQMYCDEDMDLVADLAGPGQCKDPDTLVFTYTPVEDPAVYRDIFAPFQKYLEEATGKKVVYYTVQSNAAEVEAMRSGRLHIAGFSTGPTGFAVNLAGYVPMAVKGYADGFQGYNLIVVVQEGQPHPVPGWTSRASGWPIPRPRPTRATWLLGPCSRPWASCLTRTTMVVYSGKHDQSILGVAHGDYDAAPVASDVYERMVAAGRVEKDVSCASCSAAPSSPPRHLATQASCVRNWPSRSWARSTPSASPTAMKKAFKGADRFYPITYMADWKVIRDIAAATGTSYNEEGLRKMAEKEAAKKKKK